MADTFSHYLDRLAELNNLPFGWYDGKVGFPPTYKALAEAERLLRDRFLLPDIGIFPTVLGGITLEGIISGGWDHNVDISPSGISEIYGIEISGTGVMEHTPLKNS